jgi:hypothetical protein
MQPEDQLLLLLARQDLTDVHQQAIACLVSDHAINWEVLSETAVKLGIAPLVYTLIRRHPDLGVDIPLDVAQTFQQHVSRQVLREAKREQRLVWAIDYFQSKSVRLMLIKGAALKVFVYDCPWYTIAHDLDIVLDRQRDCFSKPEIAQFVRQLAHKGIEFDFFQHHDVNMNGALAVDFDSVWRDARQVAYAGKEVWLMCPEDLLISLCINSCRKRFFRLKSLCDIAETMRKHPALDWAVLARKAHWYGCQNIVYAALYVTARTVGCDVPPGALNSLNISPIRAVCIHVCADFLLRHLSLASPAFGGNTVLGRKVDWLILLPYATYTPAQLVRKAAYIQNTWAGPDVMH